MSNTYDAPNPVSYAWSAVDPVSLRLAVDEFLDTRLPRVLGGSVPSALARLVHVEKRAEYLRTTLDLTRLGWEVPVTHGAMEGDDSELRWTFESPSLPVMRVDGRRVTRIPMSTPNGDPVHLWVHEQEAEREEVGDPRADFFELTAAAREIMAVWEVSRTETTAVSVPVQQFVVTDEVFGLPVPVVQELRILLRPEGFAATWGSQIPDPVMFGTEGPLLMWFSEPGAELPAALLLSHSSQWLRPGEDVDLTSHRADPVLYGARGDISQVRALAEWIAAGRHLAWFRENPDEFNAPEIVWDGVLAGVRLAGPDFRYLDHIKPIYDQPIGEATWRDMSTWFTWQSRGDRFGYGHLTSELCSGRLGELVERFLELWDAPTTA
ncbi:hypothetical protein [Corynebacterium humireducens]|uniref:hypothetical protein n=1 Tax=Corynebacterium humireducens TaxID=1223514 RepID=UPI000A4624A2|nr:hypothetical protein [Corynebacterium humireducens]